MEPSQHKLDDLSQLQKENETLRKDNDALRRDVDFLKGGLNALKADFETLFETLSPLLNVVVVEVERHQD
jgi:hypothetical protein